MHFPQNKNEKSKRSFVGVIAAFVVVLGTPLISFTLYLDFVFANSLESHNWSGNCQYGVYFQPNLTELSHEHSIRLMSVGWHAYKNNRQLTMNFISSPSMRSGPFLLSERKNVVLMRLAPFGIGLHRIGEMTQESNEDYLSDGASINGDFCQTYRN